MLLVLAHSGFIAGSIETRAVSPCSARWLAHSGFIAGSIETRLGTAEIVQIVSLIPALLPAQLKLHVLLLVGGWMNGSFRLYCRLN